MVLTKEFYQKLNKISTELSMNPRDLLLVMYAESGLKSSIVNQDKKYGGAVGLIQFMPDTLRGLGVPQEKIASFGKTSAEEQLDYVKKYVRGQMSYAGRPFKSASEYYHANFFPKTLKRWRGSDPIENANTIIVSKRSKDPLERVAYKANTGLDANHDGNITVGDMTTVLMRSANNNGFQEALSQLNSIIGRGEVTEISKDPNLMKITGHVSHRPIHFQQQQAARNSELSMDRFLDMFNDFFSQLTPTTASENTVVKIAKESPKFTHSNARDTLEQAYKKLYKREPSEGELDFGLATAFFETGYGRAGSANSAHPGQFARWASEGKYNWGALETGIPGPEKTLEKFKNAGLHPTKEKGNDAGRPAYFYLFPNDVEAATAFLMSWGQPDTLRAAASGSASAVAKSMKNHNYYEGFWVPPGNPKKYKMPPFKEASSAEEAERNNIRDYASALNGHKAIVVGKNNHDRQPQQVGTHQTNKSSLGDFLERINQFFSFTSIASNENKILIVIEAEDFNVKAEYARILQSVLNEELKINSSIHYSGDVLEVSCGVPFNKIESYQALKEVCAAVSDVFKFATLKIGGCETLTVISPDKLSIYPEMDIKMSEINRRKFQFKMAQGNNVNK